MVVVQTGNAVDIVFDYNGPNNTQRIIGIKPHGGDVIPLPDPRGFAEVLNKSLVEIDEKQKTNISVESARHQAESWHKIDDPKAKAAAEYCNSLVNVIEKLQAGRDALSEKNKQLFDKAHCAAAAGQKQFLQDEPKTREINELIRVDLDDIIGLNLESFLDMIADDAGYSTMQDIGYTVEGHEGDVLLLRVTGFLDEDSPDWMNE